MSFAMACTGHARGNHGSHSLGTLLSQTTIVLSTGGSSPSFLHIRPSRIKHTEPQYVPHGIATAALVTVAHAQGACVAAPSVCRHGHGTRGKQECCMCKRGLRGGDGLPRGPSADQHAAPHIHLLPRPRGQFMAAATDYAVYNRGDGAKGHAALPISGGVDVRAHPAQHNVPHFDPRVRTGTAWHDLWEGQGRRGGGAQEIRKGESKGLTEAQVRRLTPTGTRGALGRNSIVC